MPRKKKARARGAKKETKDEDVIEIPVGNFFSNLRKNPWIVSTFIFALLFVIVLFMYARQPAGSAVLSKDQVAQKVVDFINADPNLPEKVSLSKVDENNGFYVVTVKFQGRDVDVYATRDGKYIVRQIVPLDKDAQQAQNANAQAQQNSGANAGANVEASADDDAVLGDPNAPVTIIEFSDYQCPFCHRFWSQTLPQLKKDYIETGKVKLVYRDFPLNSIHPMAQKAAEAAECVRKAAGGSDEAYFKMHDKIFENQQSLSTENLKAWAKELGYDISSCLDNDEMKDEVDKDAADAQAAGAQGTPYFVINGKPISGAQPYSVFKQYIDAELASNADAGDAGNNGNDGSDSNTNSE
ncbi:hypothetical protein D6817_03265 [Candidatus Pacearchaeota archaeon]|nr:MAG: hypothetical protein D6817_03265 [Candidatus Pacearchaeota archaeon]